MSNLRQDAPWDAYESAQIGILLRVYDFPIRRVRIDSTTVKSYVTVTEDGLFQLGHSKEHRPDLPQLKINQSVLDPLGIPLTTTIVSGECVTIETIPAIKTVNKRAYGRRTAETFTTTTVTART